MLNYLQIAIDGPAGAGKSSIAKELAKKFKYIYIDTGAMYRALTLVVMEKNIPIDEVQKIEDETDVINLSFKIINDIQEVYIGKRRVTEEIRSQEVSKNVSAVSAISGVRKKMVNKQRELAGENNVVMDGRDIGTVVLPEAKIKIFLTASPEERARRRYLELKEKGQTVELENILEDIKTRDHMDETRETSPLIASPDAIIIDTTKYDFNQVLEKIEAIIKGETKYV